MNFTVRLAGVNVGITSIFDEVYFLCGDYISDEAPDFEVRVTEQDIILEREKAKREAAFEHRQYVDFPDPYLETLSVYRKIAVGLLPYGAFVMHGAVVGRSGRAYMFTAPSGVGKTTHVRFWLRQFPDSFVINGDKPILLLRDGGVYACGTPWAGKEKMNTDAVLPLKAISFLFRGSENSISPARFTDVYPMLIGQSYRPEKADDLKAVLRLIKKLGESVDFYFMKCNLDPAAANVAFEGMSK